MKGIAMMIKKRKRRRKRKEEPVVVDGGWYRRKEISGKRSLGDRRNRGRWRIVERASEREGGREGKREESLLLFRFLFLLSLSE